MEANLAVLIDFENIAAGTEKEGLGRFDVDALMRRIKDKGRILVARSYADWGRFARFKQTLLGANVTMMELTSHGMQDKNRADIAMVVDCLELAFTKSYIDTFVVVSGDSDFTPLVLKMRELNKRVIGCGTRASTSRLLIQACDEWMFYDTIVKEAREHARRPAPQPIAAHPNTVPAGPELTEEQWYEAVVETLSGIQRENPEPCLASVLKTALLRKNPDFDEIELGYSSFARFLDSAAQAGYVRLSRDQKAGGYRVDQADLGETAPEADADDRPRGEANYADPYLTESTRPLAAAIAAVDTPPLAFATRMTVLQAIEQAVDERRKRRRRITVPFVLDDVRKRLKKSHPDIPGNAPRGLLDAMLDGSMLIHRDGKAIRSPSAPFGLDRDADGLNRALCERWIRRLRAANADLSDSAAWADLLLGNAERRREVEELVAWAANHPEGEDAPSAAPEPDLLDSMDDLLFAEEADAPAPAAPPTPVPAPSEHNDLLDALLIEPTAEPAADPESADGDRPNPRRRRRRRVTNPGEALAGEPVDE